MDTEYCHGRVILLFRRWFIKVAGPMFLHFIASGEFSMAVIKAYSTTEFGSRTTYSSYYVVRGYSYVNVFVSYIHYYLIQQVDFLNQNS